MYRVLLVDDERAVTESLSRYLSARGFIVDQASGCGQAIAALSRGRYDAVLLDIRLGDGSGMDVLHAIRRDRSDVAVVLYSAYATLDRALEAGALGVIRVLQKPKHPREVMEALQIAVLRKQAGPDPLRDLRGRISSLDRQDCRTPTICQRLAAKVLSEHQVDLWQFSAVAAFVREQALGGIPDSVEGLLTALDLAESCPSDPTLRLLLDVVAISGSLLTQELARSADVPASQLRRVFQEFSLRTPRRWTRLARVRRSLHGLMLSNRSIAECAYDAGYPTARQFSRDCQTELGLSPKCLRRIGWLP